MGSPVNVEVDMLARYVERLMSFGHTCTAGSSSDAGSSLAAGRLLLSGKLMPVASLFRGAVCPPLAESHLLLTDIPEAVLLRNF